MKKMIGITVKTQKTMELEIGKYEKEDLQRVYDMLHLIAEQLRDGEEMISESTGEVISKSDLTRVRGVLDGLYNNTNWVVKER